MNKLLKKYSWMNLAFARFDEGDGDGWGGGGGGDTPIALVDSTGKFAPNWHDSELLEEGIRGHESLKTVTGLGNMAKQLVTANQMIGKDKVIIPGPDASDAEKDAFYNAGGRPATAGDYKIDVPEGLKEVFTDERLTKIKDRAYKLGASQEQLAGYLAGEFESMPELMQSQEEAAQKKWDEDETDIRTRLGAAREERIHIANRLIAEVCGGDAGKERQVALLEKYGHDPDFIEFASDCGAKLVSHKALIGELTLDTPKEAIAKIAELRATPGFVTADKATGKYLQETDPAKKQAILADIDRLTKEAYPDARPAPKVW